MLGEIDLGSSDGSSWFRFIYRSLCFIVLLVVFSLQLSLRITVMFSKGEQNISKHQFLISGILTTVFGIDELCPKAQVVCLWLHHGRLGTWESMQPLACHVIQAWNARSRSELSVHSSKGLIAVAFDQRNHGSRKIDSRANKDWRAGNKTHAQDMYSIYRTIT